MLHLQSTWFSLLDLCLYIVDILEDTVHNFGFILGFSFKYIVSMTWVAGWYISWTVP